MSDRLDSDDLGPSTQRRAFKYQIEQRLEKKKMSAADLSRATGLSKDAIGSYVHARSLPTKESLVKIAKALGCKPDALKVIPSKRGVDPDTLVEIREYYKPGYKLLVARVPIPADVIGELFDKLMAHATPKKKRR
jgi:transcriptional regulator with XRE-family HTH domain